MSLWGMMMAATWLTIVPQGPRKTVLSKDTLNCDTVFNDSVVSLHQITVEGAMQRVIDHGVEFTPGSRQKKSAVSGSDLLFRMAVPQLSVMPGSDAVADRFGNKVDFFINGIPATKEQVTGIRPTEVRRVQYLEYPTDPRFRGAQNVVNFIVQPIHYGGYTKLKVNESVMAGLSSNASLFSKFSYKAMTYDVYAQAFNWNFKHGGTDRTLEALPSSADIPVVQTEKTTDFKNIQNSYPFTFRATWEGKKATVTNRLSFGHWSMKENMSRSSLVTSYSADKPIYICRDSPERENSLEYEGDVFLSLPHNYSLSIWPEFRMGEIKSDYVYADTDNTTIDRMATERSYSGKLQAWLQTAYGKHHTMALSLASWIQDATTHYSGQRAFSNRYRHLQLYGAVQYTYSTARLNVAPRVGIYWRKTTDAGISSVQANPTAQVSVEYRFNRKHSVLGSVKYAPNHPNLSLRVNQLLQQNNLLWTQGNLTLKASHAWSGNLGYNFIPSNTFSLLAYAIVSADLNRVSSFYERNHAVNGIVRGFHNDGDFKYAKTGLSATLKLLGNRLHVSSGPAGIFQKASGLSAGRLNNFNVTATVSYYAGPFYATAFYQAPASDFVPLLNEFTHKRDFYFLQMGWGNSEWNLRIDIYDVFKKNWETQTGRIDTPLYKEKFTSFGQGGHGRISFSAIYTFGYGKSVKHTEVGAMERSESSIVRD